MKACISIKISHIYQLLSRIYEQPLDLVFMAKDTRSLRTYAHKMCNCVTSKCTHDLSRNPLESSEAPSEAPDMGQACYHAYQDVNRTFG